MKIINKIWTAINEHETIICLAHINPDGDAYASQIALSLLIKKVYPQKKVFCFNEYTKRFTSWNQYLQPETKNVFEDSLVIITDTAFLARINSKFFQHAKTIIKIDHHLTSDYEGDICWIDATASSTSQMIVMLIVTLQLTVTATIAEILYLGMISDTNRFHYPVVNSTTFDMLAFLTSYHLNLNSIYDKYYEQSLTTLQLKALVLAKCVIFKEKIVVCSLPAVLLKPLNISAFTANEQVDLLANIENAKIWMMFSQTENNGPIIGIFRSNTVKVNLVVERFGGGGHFHYAGGTFNDWTQVEKIIDYFNNELSKLEKLPII